MQCRYHPDREARVRCEKMQIGYCEECLESCDACTDPNLYCKWRQGCIIWEMCKRSENVKKRREAGRKAACAI